MASLKSENVKLSSIMDNNRVIQDAMMVKVGLYEGIIDEKDKQLKLASREVLVSGLKSKNKNWSLEILLLLGGGLLGYAIHK